MRSSSTGGIQDDGQHAFPAPNTGASQGFSTPKARTMKLALKELDSTASKNIVARREPCEHTIEHVLYT